MAQGIFGGATSYEEQSLTDIDLDIQKWIKYTEEIKKMMNSWHGWRNQKEMAFGKRLILIFR